VAKRASRTNLLVTLGVLTWRQCHYYTDAVTLYDETLTRNPDCYLCRNNVGMLSLQAGEREQAIEDFREAVRIAGRTAEAKGQFEAALRILPDYQPAKQKLSMLQSTSPKQ